MNQRYLRPLILCLGLLLIVACGTPATTTTPATTSEAASGATSATTAGVGATSNEKVKLVFWHHTYPPATEWMKQKIAEWETKNPNVSIELVEYPHGDYEVKLLSAISAGNAPDIMNLLDYLFPKYISKNLLAPAAPQAFNVADSAGIQALYEGRALEGLTANNNVYGVPAEHNTLALFLNAKHFEEAGLDAKDPKNWPKTWDDLFALAKKLEKRDASGNLTRIGFNWVWGQDLYWYAQQYWPILNQYGCKVFDANGKSTINSPPCVRAFEETWMRLVSEKIGGPDVATKNAVDALQDFADGRQSMCIAGVWAPPAWKQNPDVYNNYVVAPLPQHDPQKPATLLNAYALAVSASSKHPDEAWRFLNFLTSDSGGLLKSGGYISGRKGWETTPEAKATKGIDIFANGYQWGSYVWRSPTFSEEGTAIKNAIEGFASQGMSVQDALNNAAQEIDSLHGK